MTWFKNLKVGTKLIGAFLLVAMITATMGWIGINSLANINSYAVKMYKNELLGVSQIKEANVSLAKISISMRNMIIATNQKEKEDQYRLYKEYVTSIENEFADARNKFTSDEAKRLINDFDVKFADYQREANKLLEIINASSLQDSQESIAILRDVIRPMTDEIDVLMKRLSTINEESAKTASELAVSIYDDARQMMIALVIVAVVLGLLLGWFISRQISPPLIYAAEVANRLSEGDLNIRIDDGGKDEIGQLLASMGRMIDKLSSIIGDVRGSADNLSSASEEVSATAQSLSQAASEQAASVEQTTASMEEMNASITQNTENAKVTDDMASKSADEAQEGGEAVAQTVSAMKEIADRIQIIDDIAYQTNLLALNAAIEAARAGEHGKGFAVVAAEVRKLAERSQTAAQEIIGLADNSVARAERAGVLLSELVPSIVKTASLVQEISAASAEQATGVAQVNAAMTQVSDVTQSNASSSEELAATSEEMSSQAQQLQQLMAFFKIGDQPGGSSRALLPTGGSGSSGNLALKSRPSEEFHEPDEQHFVKF